MEIRVLEEAKNRIRFEVKGEDHTLCNLLRKELWNNKHVTVSGYNIDHPLVSEPIMLVETDGKEDPRKVLIKAVDSLKNKTKEFLIQINNLK